jgi:predicted RNA methylase
METKLTFTAQETTAQRPAAIAPATPLRMPRVFPTWHFSMMNDRARNRALYDVISAIDLTDKVVFEIGTGAGLIAMYFARRHVYTCETEEQMYELAVQTIKQNGMSDRITVIHASSTEFIRSADFNFSPDIIFTETLDCGVVGEGYFNVAADISKIAREDTGKGAVPRCKTTTGAQFMRTGLRLVRNTPPIQKTAASTPSAYSCACSTTLACPSHH